MTLALRVLEAHARTYRHTWKGSAVTAFANPVLFLLAMGLGLGTLVNRGGAALPGATYLEFLAPGLLAASAMQNGAGASSWPVLAGMKWQKTYEAALATPIGARDLAIGHLLWVGLRLALATIVFALVMIVFGAAGPVPSLVAIAPAVLTGFAFAGPITAYAARLQSDYGLSSLYRFGIVPMFLFSGTFFPITQLPGWLQPAAAVVPLWHGVELTRAAALGTAPAWHPVLHVAYQAAWLGIGAVLAVRAFERRLVR